MSDDRIAALEAELAQLKANQFAGAKEFWCQSCGIRTEDPTDVSRPCKNCGAEGAWLTFQPAQYKEKAGT